MADTQKLVLTVPSSNMAALLEMLRQFEAVKVERLEDIIARYMRNAPKTVLMDENEVADILMEVRYGKRAPSSSK